ncbi:MAG: hypothetical protein KatS3mg115_0282 [Candidatus Poribacteria bacterium]|nr:MAG: hypothetical protein KatS3mg115_0282 [Candidatus Poribacteria bacterium]
MERTRALCRDLAEEIGLSEEEQRHLLRAAELAKADLTTQMVFEFPELQGIMGRYYALESGEPEPVARAIEEHYLPLSATSELPGTRLGALLSIADKVDTLVGYFGIGQKPTGSQDPYSLRRQAIGTLRILLDKGLPLSLYALVHRATELYGFPAAVEGEVLEFFQNRLENLLEERGYRYDLVDAVLAAGFDHVGTLVPRLEALLEFRNGPDFSRVYPALNRTLRILPDREPRPVDAALLREPAEKALAEALQAVRPQLNRAVQEKDYAGILRELGTLQEPIDRFFDQVLVMDQDERVRNNRLGLLGEIARYVLEVADITRLVPDA